MDYITAARVVGVPNWRILFSHIIPNSFYPLLVVASLDVGTNVLTFAALSFLRLGTSEGHADWGQLLSYAAIGSQPSILTGELSSSQAWFCCYLFWRSI